MIDDFKVIYFSNAFTLRGGTGFFIGMWYSSMSKKPGNPINSTRLRYLCDEHGVIIIPGICRYGVNF